MPLPLFLQPKEAYCSPSPEGNTMGLVALVVIVAQDKH
jgi:hypothetical protein